MHISGRNDSSQLTSHGEDYGKEARSVGLPQQGIPRFDLGMFQVGRNQNRSIEKHLLRLRA
jgi:hypothetical protein